MNDAFRVRLSTAAASLRATQRRLESLGDDSALEGLSALSDDLYDAAWRLNQAAYKIGVELRRHRYKPVSDSVSVIR